MLDQQAQEREQFAWLAPENQARLTAFKAHAVNHALLDEVDRQLTQAVLESAGFAHVLVYGPSGVGKTAMLRRVTSRIRNLYARMAEPHDALARGRPPQDAPSAPPQPLLVVEARLPDGQTFHRATYYRVALLQLRELYYKQWSLVDIHMDRLGDTMPQNKRKGRAVPVQ
jgi:hypothetical protein